MKPLAAAMLALLAIFCVSIGVAMRLYPGGTWSDPSAVGHRFWENFFCDLLHIRALDGESNERGARAAKLGMLAFAAALVPFWILLGHLVGRTHPVRGRTISCLGVLSALGLVAVTLTPSDRFPRAHGFFVLVGVAPALVAQVAALARQPTATIVARLGWLTLATSSVDAMLYFGAYATGTQIGVVLPALQKVAAVSLLAWMSSTAMVAWRL
jgi:hypothetical protein